MRTVNRRGLGAGLLPWGGGNILYGSVISTAPGGGAPVDCSQAGSWFLNTGCWSQMSLSSWRALSDAYNKATYIAPSAPAVPAAPSTQAQLTGAAPWSPEQAIAQTYQTQTQQNQELFSQVQANVAATQGPAAAGLYDCTKWGQLFTDTSNFVANCDMTGLWIAGGVGLVVLLLLLRR